MSLFSDNIIFGDTEFSHNDPQIAEVLSIGLVKMDGTEFYIELEYDGEVSQWVKENIFDSLTAEKVSRERAVSMMQEFVGDEQLHLMAFVNQFDVVNLHKLFYPVYQDEWPLPIFQWPSMDFASILFAHGIDPMRYYPEHEDSLFKELGIDDTKYEYHNALGDAKLLRETYLTLFGKKIKPR